MNKIYYLILLINLVSYGQIVKVDTIKFTKRDLLNKSQINSFNYPVFRTTDVRIESILNNNILYIINGSRKENEDIIISIANLAEYQDEISFTIFYNKNGLLSLNIYLYSCGAYCSGYNYSMNFSTITGEEIFLDNIISQNLIKKIEKDFKNENINWENDLKKMYSEGEISLDTYDWVIKLRDEYPPSRSFILHNDYIEITEKSYFPNAIKAFAPYFEKKYYYKNIQGGFKTKFKTK